MRNWWSAMRFMAAYLKLLVEPTGCLGLAAVRAIERARDCRRQRVGVILSGGNIDVASLLRPAANSARKRRAPP
jgi:threonine dehydratase